MTYKLTVELNKFIPVFICAVFAIIIVISSISCNNSKSEDYIICNDDSCYGSYIGPEFNLGSDIAHQFSNTMCKKVGDKLKNLYTKGLYSKVDFSKIKMSTKGMGSGKVIYNLSIPFLRVHEKCMAFTSFDHVGGWNHMPELEGRKKSLNSALMNGDTLFISKLNSTTEGLKEYWIQWRNKKIQNECSK